MNLKYAEFVGKVSSNTTTDNFAFTEVAHTDGLEVPLHTHVDAHFQFILNGRFRSDALNDQCGAGTLIYNPAGVTHRDHFVSAGGSFTTVSISASYVDQLSDSWRMADHPLVFQDSGEAWIATRLWYELAFADSTTPAVIDGLAVELIARTASSDPLPGHAPAWFARALDVIEDRFHESLRVSDVASAVGVHPFHLTRTFRRYMRCSTGEYLRACRVRRACELLRNTSESLSGVAFKAGFPDQSELTKLLRRFTSFTPAKYRAAFGRPA